MVYIITIEDVNFISGTLATTSDSTSQQVTLLDKDYQTYLKYQVIARTSSIAVVAQTSKTTCLTQSPSNGLWILHSGGSYHISGNKKSFSSFSSTSTFPTVTLANGCKTTAKGIGLDHHLPFLFMKMLLTLSP